MTYESILREEYDRLMAHMEECEIVPNDACSKIYVSLLRERVEARCWHEENIGDYPLTAGTYRGRVLLWPEVPASTSRTSTPSPTS